MCLRCKHPVSFIITRDHKDPADLQGSRVPRESQVAQVTRGLADHEEHLYVCYPFLKQTFEGLRSRVG